MGGPTLVLDVPPPQIGKHPKTSLHFRDVYGSTDFEHPKTSLNIPKHH